MHIIHTNPVADVDEMRLGILLGADGLLGPRSGIGRMTLEIVRAMGDHPGIADFALLVHRRLRLRDWLDALDAAPVQRPAAATSAARTIATVKHLFGLYAPGVSALYQTKRSMEVRRQLRPFKAELEQVTSLPLVYHEPNMILAPFDGPCVATLNDLSWHHDPGLHPAERIRWIERNLPRTLARADRFVAISAFTRDEAVRVLGVPRDRIDVAHLAPSSAFWPVGEAEAAPALRQLGLRDQGYVLSVSTLEPRKNFDRLLEAYLGLPDALRQRTPLVIAGGKGWGTVLDRPDATRAVAAGQLRLLGHVSDELLVALTARCAAFAYVSLYEGFGLPVVEAMATGVPVVASATTATGETAGDGAVLVDPLDPGAIRDGLRPLLEAPDRRAAWAAAASRRAADFSWRRTVDGMAATWRAAASSSGSGPPRPSRS